MTPTLVRTALSACCLLSALGVASAQVAAGSPQAGMAGAQAGQAPPARKPVVIKGPVRITARGPDVEPGVDSLDLDFSGAAADTLRQRARPAPVALRAEARRVVAAAAAVDKCGTFPDGDRLFFADLDGDGRPEGLAIYTLESCGGGNSYIRSATVLRESPHGGWTGGQSFPMGSNLVGDRTITGIAPGALTLTGGDAPETVRIAPAGG